MLAYLVDGYRLWELCAGTNEAARRPVPRYHYPRVAIGRIEYRKEGDIEVCQEARVRIIIYSKYLQFGLIEDSTDVESVTARREFVIEK
jgi:hypothetical protein